MCLRDCSTNDWLRIRIPRVWDDPGRRAKEKGNERELARLSHQFREAMDEWKDSITMLRNWIRYSPPSSDTASPQSKFNYMDEEEDGGAKTVH